jgi:hypothetical protein
MPQQLSNIGFGTDATVLSGFALRLNDRFGSFAMTYENVGPNVATFVVREFVSGYPTSSYVNAPATFGGPVVLQPGGVKTISYVSAAQQIGLFGSGNTQVNATIMLRNPADRRNPTIECIPVGKQGTPGGGWGFAAGFNQAAYNAIYPNI